MSLQGAPPRTPRPALEAFLRSLVEAPDSLWAEQEHVGESLAVRLVRPGTEESVVLRIRDLAAYCYRLGRRDERDEAGRPDP
jgi:hypothetical protein